MPRFLAVFAVALSGSGLESPRPAGVLLTPEQVELALQFSPLPDPPPDPTNAFYENPAAARFGQALFFDQRLSGPGTIACASCHDPRTGWSDGRPLAKAVAFHPRHTMSLWNVAYNRWFFWDGRKDSLWSQALAPFEDPREHSSSRLAVLHVIGSDPGYARAYADLFGPLPDLQDRERFPAEARPVPGEDEHPHAQAWAAMEEEDRAAVDRAYAHLGKSIAAFERAIVSRASPFDRFVEGLRTNDPERIAAFSDSAQRGFALFAGKARCHLCHDGPNFTDMEFHSTGVPTGEGTDPGRSLGIKALRQDPFNCGSVHADDGGETARLKLSFPPRRHAHLPGEFKTPTLRNVARTAPYMHEGQLATLEQVVEFYSTLATAHPQPPEGETILQPLHLTPEEKADLVAFLESLTDEGIPEELLGPPAERPPR
jgi:cytochrome c peroxidase